MTVYSSATLQPIVSEVDGLRRSPIEYEGFESIAMW